jgi:predicted nucleic acid-binding protein
LRIAVTDACIFIELCELDLVIPFFELPLEVHTTVDVYAELHPHQQKMLDVYQSLGKLTVHNISAEQRLIIMQSGYPKSLSPSDQTVIFLAQLLNAIVVSSDKPVRHNAKIRSIEYHGMLWILDQMVEKGLCAGKIALEKLESLFKTNYTYQNNAALLEELQKRKKTWDK